MPRVRVSKGLGLLVDVGRHLLPKRCSKPVRVVADLVELLEHNALIDQQAQLSSDSNSAVAANRDAAHIGERAAVLNVPLPTDDL